MNSLISILIPAYNAAEWVSDTIQSALSQTWSNKEIIIVDDGSKDQTFEIARRFSAANVKVVKQENGGAAAARNHALSHAQGDYIQWLDADDLLAPNKIQKQMIFAEDINDNRKLLSSAWGSFYYRPDHASFQTTALWSDLSNVDWLVLKMGQNLFMQTASWLVSRELTDAAGPWDTRLLSDDDGEYSARLLLASTGVKFVSEARCMYRNSGTSSLSYIGRSDRKLEALFLSMQLHIGYIRSLEESLRVRTACLNYIQNNLLLFYPNRQDIIAKCAELAESLHGNLKPIRMPWKYAWLEKTIGWNSAKSVQLRYNHCKSWLIRSMDKALFEIDKKRLYRQRKLPV